MSVTPKPGTLKRNRLIVEWTLGLLLIAVLIATAFLLPNGSDPEETLRQQAQANCSHAPNTQALWTCIHTYEEIHTP